MDNSNTIQTQTPLPAKSGMSTAAKVIISIGCVLLLCGVCTAVSFIFLAGKAKNQVTKLDNEYKDAINEALKYTPTPTKAEELKTVKPMSETVQVKDITWKVLEAKNIGNTIKANAEYYTDCKAEEGSTFIMLKVNIKNNSNEEKYLYSGELLDSENKEYPTYNGIFFCIDDASLPTNTKLYSAIESMNAGVQQDFVVYFEVPSSYTDLKFRATDLSSYNEEYEYIKINL